MNINKRRNESVSMAMSDLHRMAGPRAPGFNLDFVEVGNGNPIALVEYKHFGENFSDFQFRGIKRLADMAGLPAFCVRYNADLSRFAISAINEKASNWMEANGWIELVRFDRRKYLDFILALRGYTAQADEIESFLGFAVGD